MVSKVGITNLDETKHMLVHQFLLLLAHVCGIYIDCTDRVGYKKFGNGLVWMYVVYLACLKTIMNVATILCMRAQKEFI